MFLRFTHHRVLCLCHCRRPLVALLAAAVVSGCSPPPAEFPAASEEPVTEAAPAPQSAEDSFAKDFADPPNAYRLVQYQLNDQTLKKYPEYGIGGYMGFFYKELYQQGPDARKKIGPLLAQAQEQKAPVWLADDFGYPSGMGGGKVVERNPEYEVRGLATVSETGTGTATVTIDLPPGAERFVSAVLHAVTPGGLQAAQGAAVKVEDAKVTTDGVDGSWELHAFYTVIRDRDVQAQSTSAQFKHSGRYPDLLNPDAVKSFLEIMHTPISVESGGLAGKARGFYANEPHLMQLHWVMDDGPFACVSWNAEIPAKFQTMHGYDLMPQLPRLFAGDDLESRRVRTHFHQTVAELLRTNFAGQIRQWCEARGVSSSGHFLFDEYPSLHVPCYGDLLLFAAEFDVPAMDIGIPNRDRFDSFHYEQARFCSSIAEWKDRDEVVVLLDPIISGGGLQRLSPEIPLLLNSANWLFFHGVNSFTSYLPLDPINTPDDKGRGRRAAGYTPEEFRAFNEYIGRLSLVLRGARRENEVAVYYPISRFQGLYRPSNQHWSKVHKEFVAWEKPWETIDGTLTSADIDFSVVHPQAVAGATIEDGRLRIGRGSYRVLVMPPMDLLPLEVLRKIGGFEAAGGKVVWVDEVPSSALYARDDEAVRQGLASVRPVAAGELPALIGRSYGPAFDLTFTPGTAELGVARFHRDGKKIYFLMNKTEQDLAVHVSGSGPVTVLDPSTGEIREATAPLPLQIGPLRSMLLKQRARVPIFSSFSPTSSRGTCWVATATRTSKRRASAHSPRRASGSSTASRAVRFARLTAGCC
jgi:hypothetical protein